MSLQPGLYALPAGATMRVTETGTVLHVPDPPAAATYVLTLEHVGTGQGITDGGGTYPADTLVTPTATPHEGSTFDGWSEPVPVLMDADKTLYATFTLIPVEVTYQLTVLADGEGEGTVGGGGIYPAGTYVTPTATPAAGSTFEGWSMPVPVLMDTDKTITATFGLGEAHPPPAGTWQVVGPAPDALWGYGFQSGAIDTQRALLHCYWPTGNGKVGSYALASGAWTVTENGTNGPGANSHNASSAYDAQNDRVWFSSFGPQYGPPGSYRWNPALRQCEHYDPVQNPTHAKIDCAMLYDPVTKCVFSVGGYDNVDGVVGRLPCEPRPESAGAWTPIPTVGGPDFVLGSIGLRLTYTRAGIDVAQRHLWLIDDAGDLRTLALPTGTRRPRTTTWQRHAVTGPRPPVCTVYALDVPSNAIIGWAARDSNTGVTYAQTWILDRDALTWRQGPSGKSRASTRQTPPHGTEASTSGYTDPEGRALFLIGCGATYIAHWRSSGGTPPDPTPEPEPPEPPDGGGEPVAGYPDLDTLPRRTLVPVSCTAPLDTTPWPANGEAKHQRWAADERGSVWTGFGDTTPSHHGGLPSQNQGYVLDVATGQWRRWNPACRAAGAIQPNSPDELPWVYDRRGMFWCFGGVTQGSDGQICDSGSGERGATMYRTGLFRYDPDLDVWTRFACGSTNALYGHFDNRDKELLYFGGGANTASGYALWRLNVDTLHQRPTWPADFSTNPFPGQGGGNFEDYADLRLHAWAWDEQARLCWVVTYNNVKVASETAGQALHLFSLHADTGVVTRHADPPVPALGCTPDSNSLVWARTARVLVFPFCTNHCGALEAMLTYDPASGQWASHPLEPSAAIPGGRVRANTAVYEPVHDVVVLGGSVFCADGYPDLPPKLTHWFLWRP